MNYLKFAKKKWGRKACWIHGEGPWALLAHCRVLSVSLWETEAEVLEQKDIIDRTACGGKCIGNHEILNLDDVIKKEMVKWGIS